MTPDSSDRAKGESEELDSVDGMEVVFDESVDLHPVDLVDRDPRDAA